MAGGGFRGGTVARGVARAPPIAGGVPSSTVPALVTCSRTPLGRRWLDAASVTPAAYLRAYAVPGPLFPTVHRPARSPVGRRTSHADTSACSRASIIEYLRWNYGEQYSARPSWKRLASPRNIDFSFSRVQSALKSIPGSVSSIGIAPGGARRPHVRAHPLGDRPWTAKDEINRRPPSNRLATVLHGVRPPEGAGQAGPDRTRRCRY